MQCIILDCHESTAQASQRMSNSYGISSISDVSDEDLGSDNEENVNDPELLVYIRNFVIIGSSQQLRNSFGDAFVSF